MAFPAPSKKPRISTEGEQAQMDPFQDFEDEESFTADDLEKLDIIESQALSQMPRDQISNASTSSISHVNGGSHGFSFKPLASRSPNVPRKVISGFPQKGPSRHPPITSHDQTRGQDSRHRNLRQTNVTVPVAELAPSKIYTGYTSSSSQEGVKSSPPFTSSQNKYKKGVEAQPTSRNPRLQQSNVSFPLHKADSPQSQGFGVSNTMLHQDSTQHSTNKTTYQHAMPPKEVRHSLSAQTMAQGGVKNKMLTPPKGCTSSGTPNLPNQVETREAERSLKLAQELDKLKEELKNMKSERYSKDGEIQVLRQNLGKSKAEVSRLRIEKMEQDERLKREQAEKDKELAKEAESLKTQLQFKERELAEAQSSYRGLEQRLQTSSNNNNNNSFSKNPITPPRNSPRFKGASVGRRAGDQIPGGTPQQEGGFPTRESFMQTNPALGSPAKVKMRLVEEGGKTMLRSPKRLASRSPVRSPKIVMKQRKISCSKLAIRRDVTASSKLTLSSRHPNGHMSSAQLIGRLMGQPPLQDDSTTSPIQGSLISTLQTSDYIHLDSPLREDETNNHPSAPVASKVVQKSKMNGTSSKRNANYESAMRALSSLLNITTSTTGACANEPTSSKMEDSELGNSCALNTDHSNAILGVLPLLEDQLTGYIDSLHLLSVCSSSLASTCPSSSGGGAGRGLDSSLDTGAREEQLQFEMKERQAVSALQTLHCLVCYSPAAATHIIQGSGREDGGGDADTSLMEIDPSAPLIDPTQAPGRSTSQQQTSIRSTNPPPPVTPDLPKCQILKRLMKIIGMQPSEGQGLVVQDTALRILKELARRLPKEDAFRLSELLSSEILHPLLSYDSPSDTLCDVLTILSLLASKSWHLTQNLCTHSDTCLLLQVYQFASRSLSKCDTEEAMKVAFKIINLLTCITTVHEEGAAFLLDTDCQCSEEVVSALVVMLSREFRLIDPDCDLLDQRLLVIRKGLLPLHSLFMDSHFTDHRLEAEQQYNHLITEMNRLITGLPQIHRHEVGFLQDFDGSDEDEWEQDSQEQATQMEVN